MVSKAFVASCLGFVICCSVGCALDAGVSDATPPPTVGDQDPVDDREDADDVDDVDDDGVLPEAAKKRLRYRYFRSVPNDAAHAWIPLCPDNGLYTAIDKNQYQLFDGKPCGFAKNRDPSAPTCVQLLKYPKYNGQTVCYGLRYNVNCTSGPGRFPNSRQVCPIAQPSMFLWRLSRS
jgi:hypothetical protein